MPPHLPPNIIDYLKVAPLEEKRHLYNLLHVHLGIADTPPVELSPTIASTSTSTSPPEDTIPPPPKLDSTPPTLSDYVEHVNLDISAELSNNIMDELKSLELRSRPTKNKAPVIKTQWLSPVDVEYNYSNVINTPKPIADFPHICQLMDMVNADPHTVGKMSAALVSCMSNPKTHLGLHADNEDLIDQNTSICTVSFGPPRVLEFVSNTTKPVIKGKSKIYQTDLSLPATNHSLNIMKPGCQQVMRHRVPNGTEPGVRYSISFRCLVPQPDKAPLTRTDPDPPKTTLPTPSYKKRITLLAGDSLYKGLDTEKLGKGKQTVVKIAKGGRKMEEVEKAIAEYVELNKDVEIKTLFVCVGTNDIRNCKEGIGHLRSPLCDFMKSIKKLCPDAKIFIQSLLPIPTNGSKFLARNVLSMNNLLFNLCSRFRLYFVDVFGSFLNRHGNTDVRLFPGVNNSTGHFDIHPNSKGLGVLARHYIYLIHSRWFNPLGY